MSDRSTRWVSAHLYFHGDLDAVVSHVVDPAVRAIAERPTGGQYFFLRYWESGPHVRLRMRSSDHDTDAIRRCIRLHAEDYFARSPAGDRVDAEEYRATREWITQFEPDLNPSAELSPNNSVRFIPYQREHRKYGYGPSMEAVERHFMESSDIARDAIKARISAPERDLLALCALIAAWEIWCPDTGELLTWLRARGPLFGPEIPVKEDLEWPAVQRNALHALVRRTLGRARDAPGGKPTEEKLTEEKPTLRQRWTRSVTKLRPHLDLPRAPTTSSTFNVIDHCAHLLCNRLGLSLGREASVRSLACRAILDTMESR